MTLGVPAGDEAGRAESCGSYESLVQQGACLDVLFGLQLFTIYFEEPQVFPGAGGGFSLHRLVLDGSEACGGHRRGAHRVTHSGLITCLGGNLGGVRFCVGTHERIGSTGYGHADGHAACFEGARLGVDGVGGFHVSGVEGGEAAGFSEGGYFAAELGDGFRDACGHLIVLPADGVGYCPAVGYGATFGLPPVLL